MPVEPLDSLITQLTGLLQDGDFAAVLRPTGDNRVDELARLCGRLCAEIRNERTRAERMKSSVKAQVAMHTASLKTENERLELALREAQLASQSKSVFLANMSHELRTPLNAIINYSEMLLEDAAEHDVGNIAADVNKIHTAGKNLLAWVEQILELSKIESGRAELHIAKFAPDALLREIETALRPEFQNNGAALRIHCPPDIGEINADREHVRKVLASLSQNACRAAKQGEVSLRVERQKVGETEWIAFAVTDTGAGISPRLLENLFKDYTQAEAGVSSAYGAMALALAICHRFSLLMGGNIEAESELGKGSTFTLRLPANMATHLAKGHVIRATNRLLRDILKIDPSA